MKSNENEFENFDEDLENEADEFDLEEDFDDEDFDDDDEDFEDEDFEDEEDDDDEEDEEKQYQEALDMFFPNADDEEIEEELGDMLSE